MKRSSSKPVSLPEGDAPRTLAEAVYRKARQDILEGKLAADTPLRSEELMRIYEVGISPLREALSRLVSERLVTLNGQRGFRVAPVTIADVRDTMETRIMLDSQALTKSMNAASLAWESNIVSTFHALSRISDLPSPTPEAWSRHHRDFHMALLSACGSPWLLSITAMLYDHAERHRMLALSEDEKSHHRDAQQEHRQIMEAVLGGNERTALAALDLHYRVTADTVVAALQKRDTPEA